MEGSETPKPFDVCCWSIADRRRVAPFQVELDLAVSVCVKEARRSGHGKL